jgi:uncharacterized repeat protein (TIGR03803 family)
LLLVMTFIAPVVAVGVVPGVASAASFTVLYRFQGDGDGWRPATAPTQGGGGVLYGMTAGGGGTLCPPGMPGPKECGTVFTLTPPAPPGNRWRKTTLYRFQGGSDGVVGFGFPQGGPVVGNDGFPYGTTYSGGTGSGTAFKLTPPGGPGRPWQETIIHNFAGGSDGSGPWNPLVIGADGAYYGSTQTGGSPNCFGGSGCGTLFKLTPPAAAGGAWKETVLYRETQAGLLPNPGLTPFGGAFYLTTQGGGDSGCGSVSRLVPPATSAGHWRSEILYGFPAPKPGDCFGRTPGIPLYGVLVERGVIFGATTGGFAPNKVTGGTVFMLTPPTKPGARWNIEIVHEFPPQSRTDGHLPSGALVEGPHGVIFGTTAFGGSGPCSGGCGTVWQLTPPTTAAGRWSEKILHDFQGPDGASPVSISAGANGVLYGTTGGGGDSSGDGTVFEIVP